MCLRVIDPLAVLVQVFMQSTLTASQYQFDHPTLTKMRRSQHQEARLQALVQVEAGPQASLLATLDGELGLLGMGHVAGAIMEEDDVVRRDSAVLEAFGDV